MITNNFDKNMLLKGGTVTARDDENTYYFKLPTYGDMIEEIDFNTLLFFLISPVEELQKRLHLKGKNRLDLMVELFEKRDYDVLVVSLVQLLSKFIQGFEYADDCFMASGSKLTEQVFELFAKWTLVSVGHLAYEKYQESLKKEQEQKVADENKTAEELEFERRQLEAEEKVRKLKTKSRDKESGDSFMEVMFHRASVVSYEFKFKPQELYSLTVFAINHYYRICQLGARDRIRAAAFGSGNVEKNAKYNYLDEV